MDGLLQKNYRQERVALSCHPGALNLTTQPAPPSASCRWVRSAAIRAASPRLLAARDLLLSDYSYWEARSGPDIEKVLVLGAQGLANLEMILCQEEE
jgi:hypothetical protein